MPAPRSEQRLPRGRHDLGRAAVAENQRRRLIAAANELFVEQGYRAITARQIAARAAVSASTFYAIFDNVEAALVACLQLAADSLLESTLAACGSGSGAEARSEAALGAALGLSDARPRLLGLELAVARAEFAAERERLLRRLARLLEHCGRRSRVAEPSAASSELLVSAALATLAEEPHGPDAEAALGPELAQLLDLARP